MKPIKDFSKIGFILMEFWKRKSLQGEMTTWLPLPPGNFPWSVNLADFHFSLAAFTTPDHCLPTYLTPYTWDGKMLRGQWWCFIYHCTPSTTPGVWQTVTNIFLMYGWLQDVVLSNARASLSRIGSVKTPETSHWYPEGVEKERWMYFCCMKRSRSWSCICHALASNLYMSLLTWLSPSFSSTPAHLLCNALCH